MIIPTSFCILCFSGFAISSVHSQRNATYSLSHDCGAVPPNMWLWWGHVKSYRNLLTWDEWSNQQPVPQSAQEGLHHERKWTYITQEEKSCPNSDEFIAFTVVTTLIISVLLLLRQLETCFASLTPLMLLPGRSGKTYTEEPSLALRVAEHFIHYALVKRVDSLACQFVWAQRVQWVAGLCCNKDIRKKEEHPALQFFSLWRHHQKPAFPNIPTP